MGGCLGASVKCACGAWMRFCTCGSTPEEVEKEVRAKKAECWGCYFKGHYNSLEDECKEPKCYMAGQTHSHRPLGRAAAR